MFNANNRNVTDTYQKTLSINIQYWRDTNDSSAAGMIERAAPKIDASRSKMYGVLHKRLTCFDTLIN